jgi:hypothetical protein
LKSWRRAGRCTTWLRSPPTPRVRLTYACAGIPAPPSVERRCMRTYQVLDVEHHLLKGFRFRPTPGKNVPIEFQPGWKAWRSVAQLASIVQAMVAYVPVAIAALAPKFVKTTGEGPLQTRLAKMPPFRIPRMEISFSVF